MEQLAQLLSRGWFLARDISSQLILIEHLPDGRQEPGQFFGELRTSLRFFRERYEFFANQIVECAFGAEPPSDSFRGFALLDPDLFESHSRQYSAGKRWLATWLTPQTGLPSGSEKARCSKPERVSMA